MWCVPDLTAEFVERMEDVLRLYARKFDEKEPVVCLDERPVVLREDARRAVPMKPGRLARRDYEYVRCGTANVFCIVQPLTGRRLTFARPEWRSATSRGPMQESHASTGARRDPRPFMLVVGGGQLPWAAVAPSVGFCASDVDGVSTVCGSYPFPDRSSPQSLAIIDCTEGLVGAGTVLPATARASSVLVTSAFACGLWSMDSWLVYCPLSARAS